MLRVFFIASLISLSACWTTHKLKKAKYVEPIKLEKVTSFTNSIMQALVLGNHYTFDERVATERMIASLTEEKQKAIYNNLRNNLGHFKSLRFIELLEQEDGSQLSIYRYKAAFEESPKELEIRTAIDDTGRLAGFAFKEWKDKVKWKK